MRFGLYGGSFNPPHIGHLYIAEEVKRILRLDEVVMIPAGDPYLKDPLTIANKYDRLEMVKQILLDANNDVCYYEIEVERNGPSYTIDTLRQYKEWYPDASFYVIVGSDAFSEMKNWKENYEILKNSTIVVIGRQQSPYLGYNLQEEKATPYMSWWGDYEDKIIFLDIPQNGISSTTIRNNIRDNKHWEHLTTEGVVDYIKKHHLYGV